MDTGILKAGDIAAVYGMPNASVGDVLGDPALVPEMVHWVDPLLRITMRPALEQERTKLIDALSVLNEEEPTLGFYPPQPGTEIAVNSMGIIQTEVLEQILRERFGVGVVFGGRSVIYKETIAEAGEGFDAYTMPKPCWAVLRFVVEPLARGSGVEYECRVSPKKLPYRYQNHVKTAVSRALAQGYTAGRLPISRLRSSTGSITTNTRIRSTFCRDTYGAGKSAVRRGHHPAGADADALYQRTGGVRRKGDW